MKRTYYLLPALAAFFSAFTAQAKDIPVSGPDGKLKVTLHTTDNGGKLSYSVTYGGKTMLSQSPLGFKADIGNFVDRLSLQKESTAQIDTTYELAHSKVSKVHYKANELTCRFQNDKGYAMDVIFRVSDNDVAFRYYVPRQKGKGCIRIDGEATGFRFPTETTTFLTPQSDAMIGWKRTKPSYEEHYQTDRPMTERSQYGHGYTFPSLFKIGGNGWVLVSETGVDRHYCGSRLSDYKDGAYTIEYPLKEEMNGLGSVSPAFSLPGATPWRTLTVGDNLKPIVETTVPWDVVKPRYTSTHQYKPGKGTWSWIVWQDGSINYEDQVKYVDLAAAMGYPYVLVDNWWDTRIGKKRIEQLSRYAQSKGVHLMLWYSSSGYWNDIQQGPINHMDDPVVRKKEMAWLESIGVKGIKVDFFGSDKQEMIQLQDAILSDADDHGLMVIFHGTTLPRGWERMYPNYIGSEAVLASENMVFDQRFCDEEAFNACLHPFIRNTVGSMEFGGTFLNKRLNKGNNGGTTRRTTDAFQLATAVLFQNPSQNFALTPNNLTDAPKASIEFMKQVPTTWDETRFIDGYPGKYVVLARRHGDTWYVAGINAEKKPLKLSLSLPFLAGKAVTKYGDSDKETITKGSTKVQKNGTVKVTLNTNGGCILVGK